MVKRIGYFELNTYYWFDSWEEFRNGFDDFEYMWITNDKGRVFGQIRFNPLHEENNTYNVRMNYYENTIKKYFPLVIQIDFRSNLTFMRPTTFERILGTAKRNISTVSNTYTSLNTI